MSSISFSPFVRISRPEVHVQLGGNPPLDTRLDLAEQISDALLYFSTIDYYEGEVNGDQIKFQTTPSNTIVQARSEW
jgi:hypothetical protein